MIRVFNGEKNRKKIGMIRQMKIGWLGVSVKMLKKVDGEYGRVKRIE
jgi:hypothetical protein